MPDWKPITLEDGTQARQYEDGSIRNQNGAFLRQPPYAAPTITSESAPAMLQRRHQRAQEKLQAGILAAVREDGYDALDVYEAAGYIGKVLTREVVLPSDGVAARDRIMGAKWLLPAAGVLAERQAATPNVTVQIANVTGEAAAGIQRILADAYDNTLLSQASEASRQPCEGAADGWHTVGGGMEDDEAEE